MKRSGSVRGQPLAVLVMILGGWVGARATIWEFNPAPNLAAKAASSAIQNVDNTAQPKRLFSSTAASRCCAKMDAKDKVQLPKVMAMPLPATPQDFANSLPQPVTAAPLPAFRLDPAPPAAPISAAPEQGKMPVRVIGGHQLLWMAAVSNLPMPAGLFAAPSRPSPAPVPFYPKEQAGSRWSMDAWLLLRRGGVGLPAGALGPSYGASQAGAVLRYRLALGSPHKPSLYLRASSAIGTMREQEVALGLSARPVARLPLVTAVEARISRRPGSSEVRPAALAITEIPPLHLGATLRAEVYGQGGYVGGSQPTAFADGQVRLDRSLAHFNLAELRAGAGAWAGAQKGSSRVDMGPGITIGAPVSRTASMRLALDWRFRVAGNAAPESGPALTLSAGF